MKRKQLPGHAFVDTNWPDWKIFLSLLVLGCAPLHPPKGKSVVQSMDAGPGMPSYLSQVELREWKGSGMPGDSTPIGGRIQYHYEELIVRRVGLDTITVGASAYGSGKKLEMKCIGGASFYPVEGFPNPSVKKSVETQATRLKKVSVTCSVLEEIGDEFLFTILEDGIERNFKIVVHPKEATHR